MKNRPKTLVILSPAFPEDEAATTWLPAHQLFVKALKRNFPDCNIIVLTILYPDYISTYTWNDIRVTSFNGISRRKWKRISLWWDIWQELRRIRRNNNLIGLFSFWCGECALIGTYFGKFYSVRHRCWISGLDAKKDNKLVKVIRPRPQELVAMSGFLRQTFSESHGIEPRYVIPNGIDSQLFSTENSQERVFDIMGAGSLELFKQYHLFAQVVASLRSQFPEIKAIHCGNGPERENLQILIKKSGIEHNLSLLGEKSHPEVLQFMQRTKILLHTSAYEGFSTVCLEALYAGAQVISFCDPMDKKVPQWHIVQTVEEMIGKATEILRQPRLEYKPVLLHSMDEVAKLVMELFL